MLNVGWETVDALIKERKLRAYKSGERVKIVVRSLAEYQDQAARA